MEVTESHLSQNAHTTNKISYVIYRYIQRTASNQTVLDSKLLIGIPSLERHIFQQMILNTFGLVITLMTLTFDLLTLKIQSVHLCPQLQVVTLVKFAQAVSKTCLSKCLFDHNWSRSDLNL